MARLRTIDDLVADVRSRTNLESSELVDDAEILEYLCQEFAELKSHLRRNEGQPHDREVAPTISVMAGTSLYDLPVDFWELLSVEATLGGLRRPLDPYMERERSMLSNSTLLGTTSSPMYRLASRTQIEILPATSSFDMVITYVPGAPRYLLNQTPPHTVDGFNGYEMAAVYGACASCREKEETDPSFFEGRKVKLYALIDANAAQRDAGMPERVTDVTGGLDAEFFSPFGFR